MKQRLEKKYTDIKKFKFAFDPVNKMTLQDIKACSSNYKKDEIKMEIENDHICLQYCVESAEAIL